MDIRSKYNVDVSAAGRLRRTYGGRTYDSAAEAAYARELDLRQRAGDIKSWQPKPRFPLRVSGCLVCTYVADFVVILDGDHEQIIEVKGFETKEWKLKRKLLKALYPDIDLVVARAD